MSQRRASGPEAGTSSRTPAGKGPLESRQRFSRYFDLGLIGMAITSPDKNWLQFNDQLCEMLGYPRRELAQLTWAELTHPDDLAADVAQFERLLAGTIDGYGMEKRFCRKDGGIVDAAISVNAVRRSDGSVDCLLALVQDITERKRADEQLRTSERRFRDVLENVQLIALELDPQGRITFCNDYLLTLTGWAREELLGQDWFERFVPAPNRPYVRQAYADILRGSAQFLHFENPILTRSGEQRHISWDNTVQRDAAGEAVATVSLGADITERLEMEERLRQAEKMEAIGQLAGGIAHDFNNQLAGVLGYADMLASRLEDADLNRYARNIKRAASRAADLTRQLLAFGRKGKYLSIPTDMHKVVGEVVELLRRSIDKRIEIRQCLAADPATVLGDPTQLQNVLLNLALNARNAMPEGGELTFATRVVGVESEAAASGVPIGRYLEIGVTDTGTGIDAETQKRIFEPFFTTREQGEGTGLGLASVYGAVHNHRGTIRVQSEPGHGSTFTVLLPLLEAPRVEERREAPASTCAEARILVVDDEPIVRDLTADMLRSLGHQVTTCENGEDAVSYYRRASEQVDLVILDVVLPKMGARDTFVALREVNANVKALLSSGYSIDGEAQHILDEGALGFVQKPFDRAELARQVAAVLAR